MYDGRKTSIATNFSFLESTHGMVELLHHWDICKETGSRSDGWLIHAVWCIFGPKTHVIEDFPRERSKYRYTGGDISTFSFSDEDRYCTHGFKNIVSDDTQLEEEETYDLTIRPQVLQTVMFSDLD